MNTPRFTAEELDRLRELASEWGQTLSKRAFGDDGPDVDVDFRTMEQIATAAAQGLTAGALRQMLEQRAQKAVVSQFVVQASRLLFAMQAGRLHHNPN